VVRCATIDLMAYGPRTLTFWTVAATALGGFPRPVEGDAVLKDFKFVSGSTLSELKVHYRTLGEPRRCTAPAAQP
jgi:hypothetical protein